MNRSVPLAAVLLGIAGLIPFFVCGLGTLSLQDADAARVLLALIGYGAVILAFLGGVHWGFALPAPDAPGARQAQRLRLCLGVLPSLAGWLALVLPLVAAPNLGLGVLILGFIGTMVLETEAHRRGLIGSGYLWLRWSLSATVVVCLVAVLAGRLAGLHITL